MSRQVPSPRVSPCADGDMGPVERRPRTTGTVTIGANIRCEAIRRPASPSSTESPVASFSPVPDNLAEAATPEVTVEIETKCHRASELQSGKVAEAERSERPGRALQLIS